MGDLGVITLFAPPDIETLPLIMYRLMGAYRMDEAASVALILVALTLTIFWLFVGLAAATSRLLAESRQ